MDGPRGYYAISVGPPATHTNPPLSRDLSVMKPYVMTLSILLILVQKTPGGLIRSHRAKSQEPWNPCELYHGRCRDACKEQEIQYLTCPSHQRCCLELPGKSTSSNNVREDPSSNLSVTNT
ncbi:beta-defensin 116 [Saccopteryx leptura]|uniref:beta-defensin 116 n=1 Tax=Saccopteryx leptura TaxID=249018 RepID=UPI00339C4A91